MSDPSKPLIIVPEHVREPTFKWVILRKGEGDQAPFQVEIQAFNMFVEGGCLVFRQKDGKILTAVPAGAWLAVEMMP